MPTDPLLLPISDARRCGDDLTFGPEFDAIAELRREDDASLPLGDWKEKGKEPKVADWEGAAALCEQLLRTRSKDLRLAAWLTEARTHEQGMIGLAGGLQLVHGLIEHHWDGLYPLSDGDDHEQRTGSLAWLLARTVTLMHVVRAQASQPVRRDADAAMQALLALQQAVDAHLGADGPSFMPAREALAGLLADLPADADEPAGAAAAGGTDLEPNASAGAPAAFGAAPQTRAQALAQLRQVAEYFRRTEPHSPVAYLADKAARWGSTDLHSWLRTVVKDGASLAQLEDLLGVQPPAAG